MGGSGGNSGFVGEKAKNAGAALKDLLRYCKPYIPAILIALCLGAVSAVFSVIGPGKISEITDMITEGLAGSINLTGIVNICVFVAVLYGLLAVRIYPELYSGNSYATSIKIPADRYFKED